MERITTAYAAEQLQMTPNKVIWAVEHNQLPIGFVVHGSPTARHPAGKRTGYFYKELLESYQKGERR